MTPIWATLLKYEGKTLGYGLSWITAWVFWKKYSNHISNIKRCHHKRKTGCTLRKRTCYTHTHTHTHARIYIFLYFRRWFV